MPPELSRRSFLALTGGLLVVAACGNDSSSGSSSGGGDGTFAALRVSDDQYASDAGQRFAFAITRDDSFFSGPPATIAFRSPEGALGAAVSAPLHQDGLPPERGVYVVEDARFPAAGIWTGEVAIESQRVELPFPVAEVPAGPIPGQPATPAASPTFADPLGVDPICTRDPECPLHEVSLAGVVGAGTPVAVMFATPARCQSQYCQPVLDLLLDVMGPYEGDIELVHVEIYRNDTTQELVPTVEAWGLTSEPWLFGIDAGGTVRSRLGGAFDASEVRGLLDDLRGS